MAHLHAVCKKINLFKNIFSYQPFEREINTLINVCAIWVNKKERILYIHDINSSPALTSKTSQLLLIYFHTISNDNTCHKQLANNNHDDGGVDWVSDSTLYTLWLAFLFYFFLKLLFAQKKVL